jgi:hypothetical protein
MNRHTGTRIRGLVATIGLAMGSREAAAQSMVPVTIFLQTARPEQRQDPEVIHAEGEVTRIYKQIGVAVQWLDAAQARTARVIVTIVSDEAVYRETLKLDTAPASSLGVALRSTDGPSRLAFVLYGRITRVAEACKVERTSVLAVAMAHEIGHLLLPDSSHSAAGMMRGDWDRNDFWKASAGILQFSAHQADLIRTGLLVGQHH